MLDEQNTALHFLQKEVGKKILDDNFFLYLYATVTHLAKFAGFDNRLRYAS